MAKKMQCPDCGEIINGTWEYLFAIAETTDVELDENDRPRYDFLGSTEPLWDTQETLGLACQLCGWTDVRTHLLAHDLGSRTIFLVVPGETGDPITIKFELDEMDEPQTFTIDPEKGVIIPTELLQEEA